VAESDQFKWRHYQGEVILLCVRWYLRHALSYRDIVAQADIARHAPEQETAEVVKEVSRAAGSGSRAS
jgi:transposase-like protein